MEDSDWEYMRVEGKLPATSSLLLCLVSFESKTNPILSREKFKVVMALDSFIVKVYK